MNSNTNAAGIAPDVEAQQQSGQRRRKGALIIGFFTMRAPRPKPPRQRRKRGKRAVQLDLFA
ncbi:hypothetical protein [Azospirillum rugosum]|uniref:Uncharacterized protein n=1 Tax=Azospirillum rugosum TaxID=416170 RepID=A0ABS4SQ79_9PROT|nr:hypothetical protein [Azospirillum rugosum]MBP2294711.1 hypothetical protein [Azospirillum rugosum]MDQ0528000.1 hypothetical protein [Azospirillum rugosum]